MISFLNNQRQMCEAVCCALLLHLHLPVISERIQGLGRITLLSPAMVTLQGHEIAASKPLRTEVRRMYQLQVVTPLLEKSWMCAVRLSGTCALVSLVSPGCTKNECVSLEEECVITCAAAACALLHETQFIEFIKSSFYKL